MNIAILSYHTCPLATLGGKDTGGMNVYVRDLTRMLGILGVHADVFTRSQDDHVPHVLHDLGCGNRVVHIPAGAEIPITKTQLQAHLPQFVEGILEFAQQKEICYNAIYSHYWLSGLAGLELSNQWKIPIVHMFHTLALLKNQIAKNESEIEGVERINGEGKVAKTANALICATSNEENQLKTLYGVTNTPIHIIPPGVDTSRFYPIPNDEAKAFIGVPTDEKLILYVGRIEPLKGVDTLIRAISQLRRSDVFSDCPHYLAIIGGDPDPESPDTNQEMRRLRGLTEELGLNDMVVFLGKRDQATLPYYYSAAEIVVMPSHYESFGMVALEAMACGTPVIATQVGGLQYLVQDGVTGLIVPNDDVNALEERLTMLMCKSDLRIKIGQQAAVYAKGFSWEVIAPKIIDVINLTKLNAIN